MSVTGLKNTLNVRIPDWEQRTALKLSRKEPKPNAADSQSQHQIQPAHPEHALVKLRTGHPNQIHKSHHDYPNCYHRQQPAVSLQISREQQHERQGEMQYDQAKANVLPR